MSADAVLAASAQVRMQMSRRMAHVDGSGSVVPVQAQCRIGDTQSLFSHRGRSERAISIAWGTDGGATGEVNLNNNTLVSEGVLDPQLNVFGS